MGRSKKNKNKVNKELEDKKNKKNDKKIIKNKIKKMLQFINIFLTKKLTILDS